MCLGVVSQTLAALLGRSNMLTKALRHFKFTELIPLTLFQGAHPPSSDGYLSRLYK